MRTPEPDSASEVPTVERIEIWPLRDSAIRLAGMVASLVIVSPIVAQVLRHLTPLVRLPSDGEMVLRQSVWRTIWVGAFGCGLAIGIYGGFVLLSRWYSDSEHLNTACKKRRYRDGWGRQYVPVLRRSGAAQRRDTIFTLLLIMGIVIMSLGLWWHENRQFLAIEGPTVRACDGLFHSVKQRPITDVGSITFDQTRGRSPTKYITLHFRDGTSWNDRGLGTTSEQRATFADLVGQRMGANPH